MYGEFSNCRNDHSSADCKRNIFDKAVKSILLYGCTLCGWNYTHDSMFFLSLVYLIRIHDSRLKWPVTGDVTAEGVFSCLPSSQLCILHRILKIYQCSLSSLFHPDQVNRENRSKTQSKNNGIIIDMKHVRYIDFKWDWWNVCNINWFTRNLFHSRKLDISSCVMDYKH